MGDFACNRASSSMFLASRFLFSARATFLIEIKSQRHEKLMGLLSAIALPSSTLVCRSRNLSLRRSKGNVIRFFQAGISSKRVESFNVQRRSVRRVVVIAYAA